MSLISDVPFSNVTTYRVDYTKKTGYRKDPFIQTRDYENPYSGPWEEYLLPYRKLDKALKPTLYPDPKEYTEEVCKKYPTLAPYIMRPSGTLPDFDAIDRLYDNENRTVYMVDYCALGDFESKRTRDRSARELPEGWDVPLTTQRCGYRNPKLLAPEGITRIPMVRPIESLNPDEKERAILKVTTGETDYMAIIGRTGQEIIDGKLHGDINIRPQFSQDELLRAMLIRRD